MPRSRSRVEVRQKFLINASLLALLALIIVIVTSLYISSERNLHWWIDWYYPTIQIANALRSAPSKAIELIGSSLLQERNRLYVLPLVPFIWVFGSSRLVYEISLALVYLLPWALGMGAIATQLIRTHSRTVFWSTALLTVLIPVSWVPTFMGIPDTGGAALMAIAAFVYLQDVRLKQWWRVPLIGLLIGLAILLRRHFIYGGLAFIGALSLQSLFFFSTEVQKKPQLALRNLLLVGVQIGLIAATILVTLLTIAPVFTYGALTIDYKSLYTSWTLPLGDTFNLYAYYYGWATWLIVLIGFSASVLTHSLPLSAVNFLGLWGILSLVIWLVQLRYGNVFYSLHLTPLVILGLVAFIWTAWSRLRGHVRTIMLGVVTCYLVSNLVIGLTPIGQFDSVFRPLFALSMPPLVRTDYDEVIRLLNYLRQLAPNEEPIFVVGNQRLQLDSSLIRASELLLYGRERLILNVLQVPKVDSRDEYPIETLLQAQYVVVPSFLPDYPGVPTKVPAVGEWVPNKEIDVVKVVFDAFTQNWEFAQDFKPLPVQFKFSENATVRIYQRTRPTSVATAIRTLYAMQQQIGKSPGSQQEWVLFNHPWNNYSIARSQNNTYQLISFDIPHEPLSPALPQKSAQQKAARTKGQGTSFLYLGVVPKAVEVTGAMTYLDKACDNSSLQLTMLNKEGQIVSSLTTKYSRQQSASFKLSLTAENPAYLLLDILTYDKKDLAKLCTLQIDSLAVSPQK
ncbi:MAG TPA: hypothetical protein V6D14_20420 [Coleofasciculaceae cyanobacterium]